MSFLRSIFDYDSAMRVEENIRHLKDGSFIVKQVFHYVDETTKTCFTHVRKEWIEDKDYQLLLEKAVEIEDYEKAAEYRDIINNIKETENEQK